MYWNVINCVSATIGPRLQDCIFQKSVDKPELKVKLVYTKYSSNSLEGMAVQIL
jgi:ribosomal protein L31E